MNGTKKRTGSIVDVPVGRGMLGRVLRCSHFVGTCEAKESAQGRHGRRWKGSVVQQYIRLFAYRLISRIWLGLTGTGGGGLELVAIEGPIVKVRITGPAASVMTVRVAVTQKLREKFPAIAAVQLVN